MMSSIVALNKAGNQELTLVGGKALALGKMMDAKIPIPPGFVVTTEVFRAGITDEYEKEIYSAFEKLGADRVAVRSSAVAEDSRTASWAGQLESFLNVSQKNLIDAVKECWKSVESERAIKYAKEHGISNERRAVAVIVQKMVDGDISGVLFTANPISKSKDEVVIEAIFGLGELLVQGAVTPESLIIDKVSGEVRERVLHRQTNQLVQIDGKNTLLPIELSKIGQKVMNNEEITSLCRTSKAIESLFKTPQDIEWAFVSENLHILQSRSITTL